MRRRFVLVGLFFALTTVAVCCQFYLELTSLKFFTPEISGFGVRQEVGRLVVGPIKPGGPAASLQTGDEIVSLDGENTRSQTDLVIAFKHHKSDTSHSIVVRRDGQLLYITLKPDTPSLGFYIERLLFLLAPACFLLMGLLVFLLKPDDKPALLLGLWFGAISNGFPAELYMLIPAIREYRPLNSQRWTSSEAEDTLRY